jgi:hypothetical protein
MPEPDEELHAEDSPLRVCVSLPSGSDRDEKSSLATRCHPLCRDLAATAVVFTALSPEP